jgi:hypothetical protein
LIQCFCNEFLRKFPLEKYITLPYACNYYYFWYKGLRIEECPSNSPFLKNNGAEAPKGSRPIVFKEWRDTRTFSNLKSTHCTSLVLLIINLVAKKNLCIVSKVQREQ